VAITRRVGGALAPLPEEWLDSSDRNRLSVTLVDVADGSEAQFTALGREFAALLVRKKYGISEMIRDEAHPLRFYAVRRWTDAAAAAACHADPEVQRLTAKLYQLARVTHVVNGARAADPLRMMLDDERTRVEADRRTGFDRRLDDAGRNEGERRGGDDRRIGPRRLQHRPGEIDLIAAARRAREHADAAFSHFKVGAALETADGLVITGCNIENATFALTTCAERVAMFKALSEGHRIFTRIAIVADTAAPAPPCGACRQILWEFGGNLEIQLANLKGLASTHRLTDLFPMPFDARLL
jgi:cytidine deaminase